MRAAVCTKPFEIRLEEVADPEPKPDEVIVRVRATGVCGSDVRGYQGIHPEIKNYPVILGHEFAGEVAAVGGKADGWRVGQRVTVEPITVDGTCAACLRGDYHLCDNLSLNGHQYPGSFAEYTTAKKRFTYPIPDSMTFEQAAMIEPLAVCVHAVRISGLQVGDFCLVLGGGTIGQLAAQVAVVAGATVMLADPFPFKREVAQRCGIHYSADPFNENLETAIRERNGGELADVVIEAAGAQESLAQSVHLVRKGGTIVPIGFTAQAEDRINLTLVTIRELRLLGTVIYRGDYPRSIQLVEQGRVQLEPLMTAFSTLEETEQAIKTVIEARERNIKSMIRP